MIETKGKSLQEIQKEFDDAQRNQEPKRPKQDPDYAKNMTTDQTRAADADDDF